MRYISTPIVNFTGKPACMVCKYKWYEKIFEKKRVDVWNREIKRTNNGCAYCDVALCKNILTFFTLIQQRLKRHESVTTYGCL